MQKTKMNAIDAQRHGSISRRPPGAVSISIMIMIHHDHTATDGTGCSISIMITRQRPLRGMLSGP